MRKTGQKPLAVLVRVGSANLRIGLWFVLLNLLTFSVLVGQEFKTNNEEVGHLQRVESSRLYRMRVESMFTITFGVVKDRDGYRCGRSSQPSQLIKQIGGLS